MVGRWQEEKRKEGQERKRARRPRRSSPNSRFYSFSNCHIPYISFSEPAAEGPAIKTKAQKAAEKKEREKQKKKEQAAKKKKGGQQEKTVAEVAAELAAQDDEPQDTGKKGKKGKKGEEEKPKKKKGGPPAAALREMLEAQRAAEEAEKKRREEEEAKAAEALRKHNEKLEQERQRRAKKNEREKKRLERRKEEGKALTEKQKRDKARAEALLADRGIDVDDVDQEEVKAAPVKILSKAQKKKLMEQERLQREAEEAAAKEAQKAEAEEQAEEDQEDSPEVSEADEESSGDDWDNSSSDEDDAEKEEPEEEAKKPAAKESPKAAAKKETEDLSVKQSGPRPDDFFEIADVHKRIKKRRKYNKENAIEGDYRCPIVCVLGHVDTGKTKCLDNLRRTNVQDGEAGGITQHIGATNVPLDCIEKRTSFVKKVAFGEKLDIQIPGLLIIDTPGHESFSNLRSRGSSLCDVAILGNEWSRYLFLTIFLVVDIMHGLENQTRESIKLLKKKRCPFVVALNKIDRIYEWKSSPHQVSGFTRNNRLIIFQDVRKTIDNQKESTRNQFKKLYDNVYTQMAVEELNVRLFWELEGEDAAEWIPIVPTSAITGQINWIADHQLFLRRWYGQPHRSGHRFCSKHRW